MSWIRENTVGNYLRCCFVYNTPVSCCVNRPGTSDRGPHAVVALSEASLTAVFGLAKIVPSIKW